MKKIITAIICLLAALPSFAQQRDTLLYPDSYLDTVQVAKQFKINDYYMVGVEYGASWNDVLFNPATTTSRTMRPGYYGIFFSHYEKMFGMYPFFGLKFGLAYGTEGYEFTRNKETGTVRVIYGEHELGAGHTGQYGEVMHVIEAPFLASMHADTRYTKLMGEIGLYGGYRLDVERFSVDPDIPATNQFEFFDFENRFDYGLQGGFGVGLVLEPFEFHVNARVRYSWSSLVEPGYYSKYYFKTISPLDVMITGGLYFNLTKRSGKSRGQIRKEAYNIVYGN